MNRIINWVNKQRTRVLTSLLAWLPFIVGIVFIDSASAQTLIAEVPSAQQYAQVTQNVDNTFQKLLKQTQFSFEKALQDTNQVISDLPQQLERVTSEPQIAVRKQIEDDLEDRQDSLENLADSVDDLAEKVQSFNKKSLQSAGGTQFHKNALNIQQSLENVAKRVDNLADNVEKAKDNSTAAFRTQIGQQIEAVSQALDEANSAFQAINQNPA